MLHGQTLLLIVELASIDAVTTGAVTWRPQVEYYYNIQIYGTRISYYCIMNWASIRMLQRAHMTCIHYAVH